MWWGVLRKARQGFSLTFSPTATQPWMTSSLMLSLNLVDRTGRPCRCLVWMNVGGAGRQVTK